MQYYKIEYYELQYQITRNKFECMRRIYDRARSATIELRALVARKSVPGIARQTLKVYP